MHPPPAPATGADGERKGGETDLGSRDGKVIDIACGDMRQLFMSSCEDFVSWSHDVVGYEVLPAGVRVISPTGQSLWRERC